MRFGLSGDPHRPRHRCAMSQALSSYERERARNIKQNEAALRNLGLSTNGSSSVRAGRSTRMV